MSDFVVGDRVLKEGGDYRFEGQVMSVFPKRSGAVRVVVENDDGILHVFNLGQLRKLHAAPQAEVLALPAAQGRQEVPPVSELPRADA